MIYSSPFYLALFPQNNRLLLCYYYPSFSALNAHLAYIVTRYALMRPIVINL